MTPNDLRTVYYQRQNGCARLTPAQSRRIKAKAARERRTS